MAQKCVHQGCNKTYTDPDEVCKYHPGPPIFHEGQKGWKCCKPRVLTFDEFLEITPCTEGKHSTTDVPPQIEKKPAPDAELQSLASTLSEAPSSLTSSSPSTAIPIRTPVAAPAPPSAAAPPPPPAESEDDDPALEIPDGRVCRRKTCGAAYKKGQARSDDEKCVHHPGAPIFHEGSKGYSCCKRRVLEFDQFLKIEGCKTSARHLFVGSGKSKKTKAKAGTGASGGDGNDDGENEEEEEELLETVRTDFYQTPSAVIASFFLKKIDPARAAVRFAPRTLAVDLPTGDQPLPKRYRADVPLFAPIDPEKSAYKVLGTKLEVTLVKADGASWPVLRSDERGTGEILQVGRAGRV
ncbi:hypothetical protein SLS62_010761 [Diatrype stigma]|uniref:Uncharacterized protein n=1 Tax=Diatrype stigma TaxID=117547 RepID=A0AAN9YG79_9PEZI